MRDLNVLMVAPVEVGSGEIVTSLHMARNCIAAGHNVRFLCSRLAWRFLEPMFGAERLCLLTADGPTNRRIWDEALDTFRPDVVVFADYPLLFFGHGVAPLADESGWVESLDEVHASLVTLDHFGFAQKEMGLWIGPPHIALQHLHFPAAPARMQVLLPCPMHEPGPVAGRRGDPFRYLDVPLTLAPERRRAVRERWLKHAKDELLIFHSVSNWAWQSAEALTLPLYQFLPRLFEHYFETVQRPVTIVSVNNGELLPPTRGTHVRIVNLPPLATPDFEDLLFSADLALTENRISISMGKAVCGLQTCAVLKNSYRILEVLERADSLTRDVVMEMEQIRRGCVYPYEVYPSDLRQALDELILYRDNRLTRAFVDVEVFGGTGARETLSRLLADGPERRKVRSAADAYVEAVRALPDSPTILHQAVTDQLMARTA